MRELRKEGVSNRKIAKRLGVSRTSVIRMLGRPTKA
jgi:transposase